MWERMYEEFWDKLEHFCYKLCRDEDRAEDLTQEVFLKALQNRTLIEQFRRAVKEKELQALLFPEADEPLDEAAEAAVGEAELEALLTELDPLDRQLFTLRYTEGYNASELSRKFALPPGTVRTRLRKVRTLLKTKLLEE